MASSNNGITERAKKLRQRALAEPEQIDPEQLAEIISNPAAPPAAHGAAIVALSNVARVRDDIGKAFVEELETLLGRPSLETPIVLRCLRQLAANDPQAVLEIRDEITNRVSTESTAITQAATGCCVELAAEEPTALIDLVPTLSTLLDSEKKAIRMNAVYILSQVAHEYPEEVKPVVPQLIDGIVDRDEAYQTNALSTLGAIVSAYPSAGTKATDKLSEIVASDAPTKVRANAVGLLGDIAVESPSELDDHVPQLVDCLKTDDEYLAGNAAAALLHVTVDDCESVEEAIPSLIKLLEHPSPVVRRNVCKALAHFEATVALEQLKSIAKSDPDESVRSVASQTIEQLT